MYALFKDGKKIAKAHNLVTLWTNIITLRPFSISGTVNSLHFACTLEEGYTIEEVKEEV